MKLEEAVQEIKRRTDLVRVIGQTVKLKKHGPNYLGLCPFHPEKTPSFNVRSDRGYFKCFGCGVGGDVFTFLEKQSGQLFMDIVRRLAAELGIDLELTRQASQNTSLSESLLQDQRLFRQQLTAEALDYLTQKRRYPQEVIDARGLGFAGNHSQFYGRITIPIYNHRGQLVAFGGRIFGPQEKERPKYINSAASEIYEKSQVLYGLYEALPLLKQKKRLVLVEGYFDVIALLALGIPAVAPCGTSLTEAHVELIKKYTQEVSLCFDQDAAGQAAHQRALLLFLSQGFSVWAVKLLDKDPDSMWQSGHREQLIRCCQEAKDAVELRIYQALQESVPGLHKRIQALQALLPFLSAYTDPLVNRQYVRLAAQVLREDEALLVRSVLKYRPGSLQRKSAKPIESSASKIQWTLAEKLLFQGLMAHPEVIQGKTGILEADLNKDLKSFVEGLMSLGENQTLWDVQIEKDSSILQQLPELSKNLESISLEESESIINGWLKRVILKKKNAWLSEQHQKLLLASSQGNLEAVRQALRDQTGVLKKGWT